MHVKNCFGALNMLRAIKVGLCILSGILLFSHGVANASESKCHIPKMPASPTNADECYKINSAFLRDPNTLERSISCASGDFDAFEEDLRLCLKKVFLKKSRLSQIPEGYDERGTLLSPSPYPDLPWLAFASERFEAQVTPKPPISLFKMKRGNVEKGWSGELGSWDSGQRKTFHFEKFDTARYGLSSQDRAFGLRFAVDDLGERRFFLSLYLRGYDDPILTTYIGAHTSTSQRENCVLRLENTRNNIYKNIRKKCTITWIDAPSLSDVKETLFQWNGQEYTTEDPVEWKRRWKAFQSLPPLMKRHREKDLAIGPLRYKKKIYEIKRKGGDLVFLEEYPVLISGAATPVLKKLNKILRHNDAVDPALWEPDFREGDIEPSYGEMRGYTRIAFASRYSLIMERTNIHCPPFNRCYDETHYRLYSLSTGDEVPLISLFKDAESFKKFVTLAVELSSEKEQFLNKEGEYFLNLDGDNEALAAMKVAMVFSSKGVKVSAFSDLGGHYFETEVATVPFSRIPKDWLNPGQLLYKESNAH